MNHDEIVTSRFLKRTNLLAEKKKKNACASYQNSPRLTRVKGKDTKCCRVRVRVTF